MRVAIIQQLPITGGKARVLAEAFAQGLRDQGHAVDAFGPADCANLRLGNYDYLCVGAAGAGFLGGALDRRLVEALDGLAGVSGKRSFAFAIGKTFRSPAFLKKLMAAMEAQGLFLRSSAVLADPAGARRIAAALEVARRA